MDKVMRRTGSAQDRRTADATVDPDVIDRPEQKGSDPTANGRSPIDEADGKKRQSHYGSGAILASCIGSGDQETRALFREYRVWT
jgi:hypothetical protein